MNAFYVPTKIYTGEAAFENLKQYPIHNLCIICDPFVEKSGMVNKLLRVLESREFERVGGREIIPLRAGIIASTNQNLLAMSERRAFRADLYYRLSTIELYLPPLRARPEDIPLLIDRRLLP